jgi:hypothetical protein
MLDPQDEGRQLEHSSRIGAGRYDRFRKPPANDRYLREADIGEAKLLACFESRPTD